MYKCSECGAEYETKPDFCDCGNDTFNEVGVTVTNETDREKPASVNNINVSSQEQKKEISASSQFSGDTIRIQKKQKTFKEQYPGITRLFSSIDPVSGVIFLICLILSVIVILIPVTEKTINEGTVISNEKTTDIPVINSFWNDEPPAVKIKQPINEPKSEPIIEIVQNIMPVQKKQKTEQKMSAPVKKVNTPTTTQKSKTVSKIPAQSKPAVVQQKPATPVSANKPVTSNNQKEQKTQTTVTPAQTQVNTATTQPAKQTVVNNTPDPAILAAQQAKKNAEAKAVLTSYKISLRNVIGRKIDFTRVIGDGNCTVSFKVNSSGQLVNRSFTKQSDNLTLNDAVYKAVMATPSYNPPPSSYKYETLNLNIKIYNGNFEISLN